MKLEQHIKESLEGFEVEYNPADWSDMASRLNKVKAGKSSGIGKGLMIAASVIATSGIIYYLSTSGTVNNAPADKPAVETQNSITTDENKAPIKVEAGDKEAGKHRSAKNEKAENANAPVVNNAAEQKTIFSEKSESQAAANNTVNKTPVQEQIQSPVEQPAVSAVAALSASFRTDINKVCEGTQVQFIADKNDAACTYKWNFGDGEISAEPNPKHIFSEAGTYTVKLRVAFSAKDKKQAEQKNTIVVFAAPAVQMNYSVADDNNLMINFEADAEKAVDWKWDFGDKQTSSMQNPVHTYRKNGNYKVTLTARNSAGCSAVVMKDVNLKLDLLPPTAFSPDGNGVNDTWMPVTLLNGNYIFTLTITDKTGNAVFTTSDKNNAWDGGSAKPGDTFIWKAVVKDKNGEEIFDQGLITIAE